MEALEKVSETEELRVQRDHASGSFRWHINGSAECSLTGKACDDDFDCRECSVPRGSP